MAAVSSKSIPRTSRGRDRLHNQHRNQGRVLMSSVVSESSSRPVSSSESHLLGNKSASCDWWEEQVEIWRRDSPFLGCVNVQVDSTAGSSGTSHGECVKTTRFGFKWDCPTYYRDNTAHSQKEDKGIKVTHTIILYTALHSILLFPLAYGDQLKN
ncbi:hypothetical protein C8Q75DRAFT_730209 [Abortiporus biennis]|nr:hypothetical protein C8Q75DRAFT_730209 [Abortiporus biennis]